MSLPCRVAGHSAGAACAVVTGQPQEHLECIHVHSKASRPEPTGQRNSGWTHCPTVGREVFQKDCVRRQLGAGQGWGHRNDVARIPSQC